MGNQMNEMMQKGSIQNKFFIVTMMLVLIYSMFVAYIVPVEASTADEPTLTVSPTKDKSKVLKHLELASFTESFTYTIETKVPKDGKSFAIENRIARQLSIVPDSAKINLAGLKATIADEANTVSVTLNETEIAKYAGEKAILTFDAKLKIGANFSEFKDGKVPNVAKTWVDEKSQDTNEVTVKVPSYKKLVDGKTHVELPTRSTPFTYTVEARIPTERNSFVISDKFEDVLEIVGAVTTNLDNKSVEITNSNGTKETVKAPKAIVEGNTVKFEMDDTQIKAFGGTDLVITIPSKIRDNAVLKENAPIIEVATIIVDGESISSSYATVTVKEQTKSEITKTVNGKNEITLTDNKDAFTYEIRTAVPQDAKSFKLEDILVNDLQIIGTELNLRDVAVKVEGQSVKVELNDAKAKELSGKDVVLTIKAKLKEGFDITKYKNNKLPNTASVSSNDNNISNSNTVYVIPFTGEEVAKNPTLTVNGKDQIKLESFEERFEYMINVPVPKDAKSISVTNQLANELKVIGYATTNIKDVYATVNGNELSLKLGGSKIKDFAGRNLQLKYTAGVKSDADLSKFFNDGKIQNKATVQVDNTTTDTNVAIIEVPQISKTVNGKSEITLTNNKDEFTYQIRAVVPKEGKSFVLEDVLVNELQVVSTEANLREIPVTVSGQTVKVDFNETNVKTYSGKEVVLTIKAKIKENADLTKLTEQKLVNVATATTDANKKVSSNKVVVIPSKTSSDDGTGTLPSNSSQITKTVNGNKDGIVLKDNEETFVYEVKTKIPKNAKFMVVNDKLADELELLKSSTNLNGVETKFNDQRVNVTLTQQQIEQYAGKEMVIEIQARLKANFNLSKSQIPNTATLQVDQNKPVESNTVNVTHANGLAFEKTVNNAKEATISNATDSFKYEVKVNVPSNAKTFVVTDELEKVLELVNAKATVNLDGIEAKVDGQKIVVQLNEEQVKKFANKQLILTFDAKVLEGADLSKYNSKVPNTAYYQVNNENKMSSNTVFVNAQGIDGVGNVEKTPSDTSSEPQTTTTTETKTVVTEEQAETLPQTGNQSTNVVLVVGGLLAMGVALAIAFVLHRRNQIAIK
ncbi:isopeptide-forming domain-containing fimbrial protein [Lysinibacillus sp. 1P01SD]|uniref:isopeptide-forming domain-containing fimbrial protein n=1 Tax=Lysinibacillus sp. 1P01SD TaxID=3132285 RepID=UPI00399FE3B0